MIAVPNIRCTVGLVRSVLSCMFLGTSRFLGELFDLYDCTKDQNIIQIGVIASETITIRTQGLVQVPLSRVRK